MTLANSMVLYRKLPANIMGKIDWRADTVKVALFTNSYTPKPTDELYSGITGEVAEGNGYTTGGNVCANQTAPYDPEKNSTMFDADDPPTWTASGDGFSFRYIVTYDSTTGVLIGYNDYGSNLQLRSGDTFAFSFDSAGIFQAAVA